MKSCAQLFNYPFFSTYFKQFFATLPLALLLLCCASCTTSRGPTAMSYADLPSRYQRVQVEKAVVASLLAEKNAEWQNYNRRLRDNWQLDPQLSYGFDLDSGEVLAVPEADNAADNVAARPVATIADPAKQKTLVQLLTARRLCQVQVSALELLTLEKRKLAERLQAESED